MIACWLTAAGTAPRLADWLAASRCGEREGDLDKDESQAAKRRRKKNKQTNKKNLTELVFCFFLNSWTSTERQQVMAGAAYWISCSISYLYHMTHSNQCTVDHSGFFCSAVQVDGRLLNWNIVSLRRRRLFFSPGEVRFTGDHTDSRIICRPFNKTLIIMQWTSKSMSLLRERQEERDREREREKTRWLKPTAAHLKWSPRSSPGPGHRALGKERPLFYSWICGR